MSVVLEAEGKERFVSRIKADLDPTTNPPEWAFTEGTERPDTWTDGTWEGSATQSGSNWTADALTPLVGFTGSAAAIELPAGKFTPWVRITLVDELLVRQLPKITVKG